MPRPALELLPSVQTHERSQWSLQLSLTVAPLAPGLRYGLRAPVVVIHLRDGTTLRARSQHGDGIMGLGGFGRAAIPALPGIRFDSVPPPHAQQEGLAVALTPGQRRAFSVGIIRIEVEGRIVVARAQVVATTPLAVGAESNVDGRRMRIEDWSHELGDPVLRVRMTTIDEPADRMLQFWNGMPSSIRFALINPVRGEGRVLQGGGSAGALDGLVLPGAGMQSQVMFASGHLAQSSVVYMAGPEQPRPARRRVDWARDDPWFRDARLIVITDTPWADTTCGWSSSSHAARA